jgi:hypothetical protein
VVAVAVVAAVVIAVTGAAAGSSRAIRFPILEASHNPHCFAGAVSLLLRSDVESELDLLRFSLQSQQQNGLLPIQPPYAAGQLANRVVLSLNDLQHNRWFRLATVIPLGWLQGKALKVLGRQPHHVFSVHILCVYPVYGVHSPSL